jgi:hypothetical protein
MAKKFAMNWDTINQKIEDSKSTKGGFQEDTRLYKAKINEAGNAEVIIRFLPNKDINQLPYEKLISHGFKVGGQWYIENCPYTIKNKCPVCEDNSSNWDLNEQEVRDRGSLKKTNWYSNILIVKDPATPENNGKVFILKYGKKIFDKIMIAMYPPEGSVEEPKKIFDLYDGANFKYKIKTIKLNGKPAPNYDDSAFVETCTAVAGGDDDQIEKIVEQLYDIKEFTSPDKFKTYEALKERFDAIMGNKTTSSSSTKKTSTNDSSDVNDDSPEPDETPVTTPKVLTDKDEKENFLKNLKKSVTKSA